MYVYLKTESKLYTVGHYAPDGKWVPENDYDTAHEAAVRVHWLNGGNPTPRRPLGWHSV